MHLQPLKQDAASQTWYVKGVSFVNKTYTKEVPFLNKMVYKSVRVGVRPVEGAGEPLRIRFC